MKNKLSIIVIACISLFSAHQAAGQGADDGVKGHLFIIGGGIRSPQMMKRFIELAGGDNAKVLVIPFASELKNMGPRQAEELQNLGCMAGYISFGEGEADLDSNLNKLEGVTGIFFSGGDQNRLTAMLLGTAFLERIKEIYRRGGVVGGTSAGAAVMSKIMITGNEIMKNDLDETSFGIIKSKNVETAEGFGFLDFAIIDQHFIQRKRENRLINLVIEHRMLGVGIDEATAIIVSGDRSFEVFGERSVMILEPHFTATPRKDERGNLSVDKIHLSILLSGDNYTIKTKE